MVQTFESVDEILWCYHSNETSSAVLSHGTIYLVCRSNFCVCGWNPTVWPFKENLFRSTFTWCHFFSVQFLLLHLWMKCYGVTIQTSWAVLSPGTIKPYFDFFHFSSKRFQLTCRFLWFDKHVRWVPSVSGVSKFGLQRWPCTFKAVLAIVCPPFYGFAVGIWLKTQSNASLGRFHILSQRFW